MYKLISKISYVKRINCVIITLSKLLSIKIKKHFFSNLNQVKVYYKRKLEKRKKNQNATFLNSCRFPGLRETPEIVEITENFTKVTKYLIKLKETLINYVWEKSHVKKQ